MARVVVASVTEINAADERNIARQIPVASKQNELLVVTSGVMNAFIEQHFAARGVHRLDKLKILSFAEAHLVRV